MYQQNLTYQSGHPTYERASTSNHLSAPSTPSAQSVNEVNEVDLVPSYQQTVLTSGKF